VRKANEDEQKSV